MPDTTRAHASKLTPSVVYESHSSPWLLWSNTASADVGYTIIVAFCNNISLLISRCTDNSQATGDLEFRLVQRFWDLDMTMDEQGLLASQLAGCLRGMDSNWRDVSTTSPSESCAARATSVWPYYSYEVLQRWAFQVRNRPIFATIS